MLIRLFVGVSILGGLAAAIVAVNKGGEQSPPFEAVTQSTLKHVPVQHGGTKEY